MMIVEDEQRSREWLCGLLEELDDGCQLAGVASNGSDALDMLSQLKPDAVFTDIHMPMMDGMELIRLARARQVRAEFVIVSGYADFELAREAISLDVTEYILKPASREDVRRALNRVRWRVAGRCEELDGGGERLSERYPDAHPAVRRALDVIEATYAGRVNQRELAGKLGISPEYFSYIFSKNVGMTFSDFLRRFRVEQAKALYASGACGRSEVPFRVGFSDAKYFGQVFHAVEGVYLSDYLRQMKYPV